MSICSLINLIIIIRHISDNSWLWERNQATFINLLCSLSSWPQAAGKVLCYLGLPFFLTYIFSSWIYLIQWEDCVLNFKIAIIYHVSQTGNNSMLITTRFRQTSCENEESCFNFASSNFYQTGHSLFSTFRFNVKKSVKVNIWFFFAIFLIFRLPWFSIHMCSIKKALSQSSFKI